GYWLGCLCLFHFVRRRTTAVYGFLAIAFALSSSFAYRYAFEARPYALMFGFGALALVCWQWATENRRRPAAIAGMALAVMAGVYSHYYAILLVCPIAVGEFVRLLRLRRIDWPVWLALLPSVVPLASAELGTNLARYGANFWSAPRPSFFFVFYERMLQSLLLPGAFLLVVLALYYALGIGTRQDAKPTTPAPPLHEVAAVTALAGLPFFGYAVAVLVTNALVPRYVMPAILGLAVLYSWLAYFGPRSRAVGVIALLVLAGATGMNRLLELRSMARERAQAPGLALPEAAVSEPGPIVIENPLFFFEASHRSPYRSRLFYLVDPKSAPRYSSTHLDPGLPLLKRIAEVNVEDFDTFIAKHRRFTVYRKGDASYGEGWILDHLLASGARLELKERKGSDRVFLAVLPD
ncbi:MAG TPA: glycosyltransferase family 39 protein, partial [Bryobacteraceae bacterium]|nr:glycosyltransferase family 39 protein [Bryobacteraceae bacterium]